MSKVTQDIFFKSNKVSKSDKSVAAHAAFRAIADEELTSRLKKTARLKALRLQKEIEEATFEFAVKVNSVKLIMKG